MKRKTALDRAIAVLDNARMVTHKVEAIQRLKKLGAILAYSATEDVAVLIVGCDVRPVNTAYTKILCERLSGMTYSEFKAYRLDRVYSAGPVDQKRYCGVDWAAKGADTSYIISSDFSEIERRVLGATA